ncbi:IS110 family transposase [Mesorhizobium sp.]|uniref:IS110 family transposase n=1 Tax=Mesorhizobium sp. TaxID=1871066 RepID=UPI0025BBC0D7|nr:IS110 family transposase [Mesorhizobium sp.]
MERVTIIGVDLAKNVFQLHGAAEDGSPVFRRKLSRVQFCKFMASQPACVVAMEACGSSHHWARQMARLGHEPRLIAPAYVKPFFKRQKNDVADAEAIVEASQRPTMLCRTEDQGAAVPGYRVSHQRAVRESANRIDECAARAPLLVRLCCSAGIGHLRRLAEIVEDESAELSDLVRDICSALLDQIDQLSSRLAALKKTMDTLSKQAAISRRLQTMPGVGPIAALAIETFAPPMEGFKCGRDFAAWLGLVPRQKSSGGKQRLGKVSKWASAIFGGCSSLAPWP